MVVGNAFQNALPDIIVFLSKVGQVVKDLTENSEYEIMSPLMIILKLHLICPYLQTHTHKAYCSQLNVNQ